jgi:hypothetical protein
VEGRKASTPLIAVLKSFLAARLSSLLSAPIIEVDDFVSWECFAGWWPRERADRIVDTSAFGVRENP